MSPPSSFQLPIAASQGFQNAAAYNAHRPSYPQEAVDSLFSKLGLLVVPGGGGGGGGGGDGSGNHDDDVVVLTPRPLRIVEIGSGTGKFTELLSARSSSSSSGNGGSGSWSGPGPEFDIMAVEPHEGMRKELERKKLKGVRVLDGHAGRLPVHFSTTTTTLDGRKEGGDDDDDDDDVEEKVKAKKVKQAEAEGWADAVVVAQAWHWFANMETLKEVHRVLKPGNGLGIIWNVEDYNKPASWKATTKWEEKLNEWIRSIPSDGNPRFRDNVWRDVFNDQALFSLPLGEETIKWTVWLSEEALWSRINTLSQVALLEGRERESAIRLFKEALESDDVERNSKGEIVLHGITYFVWTKKI